MIRIAIPGDEPAIERFLAAHATSSMFLRSNLRARGLVDRGGPLEGTWAIAIEGGEVRAVAAFAWNGMVLVQAPGEALDAVVRASVDAVPGRALAGLSGPLEQVERARDALGIDAAIDSEDLFVLDLAELVVPRLLEAVEVRCRRTQEPDLARCARWRLEYLIETFAFSRSDALVARSVDDVAQTHARRDAFVLEQDGEIVAFSAFNARLPDVVQIGGVWTPPELRSRGHARCVVAGSLLIAGAEGVHRAVLFTGRANVPARRAYEAIGFRMAGAYGLALFAPRAPRLAAEGPDGVHRRTP